MLRTVPWLVRAAGFALIGMGVFVFPPADAHRAALAVTAAAFALSGLLLAVWGMTDARRGAAATREWVLLPVLLGGMMAASGFACAYPRGAALLGVALIAAVGAGSEASLPAGWAVTAAGVVAIEAGALVTGAGRGVILGYPLLLVVGLLAGLNRRSYRVRSELNAALLAERQRAAVLDERARIAREIHDVLAHSLGALNIQIQTARSLIAHHDPQRADEILATAQRMSTDGLAETRRAVQALRADMPPLPQALSSLAGDHRQQHRAPVTLSVEGAAVPLPPEQLLCLTRTASEALTNAAKHAPGQPVGLTLRYEDHDVTLTIRNPLGTAGGRGPALVTVNGGFGLTGMRERLLLAGGTLTAGAGAGPVAGVGTAAAAGAGQWTVTARVPR